jgi:hypothetical protein
MSIDEPVERGRSPHRTVDRRDHLRPNRHRTGARGRRPGLSDVWYCPVGSGTADGIGLHTLAISNLSTEPAIANVDLVDDQGAGPGLRIDLEPLSSELLDLSTLDTAAAVGAIVEIVGGQGAVGHQVATAQGTVDAPCGTETSDHWYFADGVTTRDARNLIVLLNPFSQDVVFNVEFQTVDRTRKPDPLQAAVVPGRSVRVIDVGEYVSREPHVATSITTVQGRLAVERLQVFDGQLGPIGASLTAAIDGPQLQWYLPAGRVNDGGDQRLTLYNPSDTIAEVDVSFDLANPDDRAAFGLVPIEVTVAPGRLALVDLVAEAVRTGLPFPAEFGITVQSTNGVGVVVERWQVTPKIDTSLIGAGGTEASSTAADANPADQTELAPADGLDAAVPAPDVVGATATSGVGVSAGSSVLADRWFVPWSPIGQGSETIVTVDSPQGGIVSIQLMVAGELLPPIRASIPAQGRVQIPIAGPVAQAPMLVSADSPIAAEVQFVSPEGRLQVVTGIPVVGALGGEGP